MGAAAAVHATATPAAAGAAVAATAADAAGARATATASFPAAFGASATADGAARKAYRNMPLIMAEDGERVECFSRPLLSSRKTPGLRGT
ncbi:hypothetical protein ADK88_08825 [Streptomyces sp. NRRL F-2295]|nr:hypothetical protein ADK88_08825 [Streptomyces sp. NRRL F-2295]